MKITYFFNKLAIIILLLNNGYGIAQQKVPTKGSCKDRLSLYEKRLRNDQQEALLQIKRAFNIPSKQWNEEMERIARTKLSIKNGSVLKRNDHNKRIPAYAVTLTKKLLLLNGINPETIEITLLETPKSKKNYTSTTLARATTRLRKIQEIAIIYDGQGKIKDKKVTNEYFKQDGPSKIMFNLTLFNGNYSQQEVSAIIAHEVTHIAEGHNIERILLLDLLQKNGYAKDAIENTSAYKNYTVAQEICADLLFAIDDKPTALNAYNFYKKQCANNKKAHQQHDCHHPAPLAQYNRLREILKLHQVTA